MTTLSTLALLGGSLVTTAVRAQDTAGAASDKPIQLNLQNVPIQTALQLLFKSAGIRNFNIASDVQGYANISMNVPFSVALTQLLNSANAEFTVENGSYNVTVKRPTSAPATVISPTPGEPRSQAAQRRPAQRISPGSSIRSRSTSTMPTTSLSCLARKASSVSVRTK